MLRQDNSQGEALQPVAKEWAAPDWHRERERAHRIFKQHAEAIANAPANGKKISRTVRDFLGDPKVRLSAALRALGGQPEPAEAFALRNRLNLWAGSYPPVVWYPKKKSSGGFRPICILPPALKAAHYMLGTIIGALLPDTRTLYGIPGRGVADALRELKALQNTGFVHLAKTDIVDCFQSIDPDALYQLPLPMEVTRQTLDYRNLTFTGERDTQGARAFAGNPSRVYGHPHKASGPTGLLQGSPASSIILAWLLKDIPTSDDARVMLCFDNIVVAARTPAGSRGMIETLTAYLRHSPAGPLALCETTFADNQPMEFLGGLFDPARPDIGIAHNTLNRFEQWLLELEEADQAELELLWRNHQERVEGNALFRLLNPYQGHYPTDIWHALRDIRAGLPFLERDCDELYVLFMSAGVEVAKRGDGFALDLHQKLYEQTDTKKKALRNILRTHPRPPKRKKK